MIKLYPNRVRTALMTFTVASFSLFSASAQTSTTPPNAVNGGSYSGVVNASSNFSGNITLQQGAQLVVVSGTTFTGNINAATNVQITVQTGATFTPNNVNNFAGKITNDGTAAINFKLGAGSEIVNTSSLSLNGNKINVSTINISNSSCGSMSFTGGLTLNSNAGTFTNSGYVSVAGGFTFEAGNQLINKGKMYVSGTFILRGAVTNDGYIVFASGGSNISGDSLINRNVFVIGGSATYDKPTRNEGLFWIGGATAFQGTQNFNQTSAGAYFRVEGSMTNTNVIAGSGVAYIKGNHSTQNQGKFLLTITTVIKDTLNFTATTATPARPCGMSESSPLPIILQNFTAKASGNAAQLNWSTVSELNGKAMIVQHSTDGTNFEDIATVASTTNSSIVQNYSYIDNNVVNGVNYYRLKLVSSDFPVSYSAVLAVKFNSTEQTDISVFPNPFSDHFTVKFADVKGGNAAVAKLYNAQGAIVLVQTISGAGSVTINTPANLTKGVYILEISANNQKYYHRLMKL